MERARAWVTEVHPHARHLLQTEVWLLELEPAASHQLRVAAVLHDIERAFPDPHAGWESARDWDSPAYLRWHQDRSTSIASDWLRERAAPAEFVNGVGALITVHEVGGWPEANLLQAADSLSFLETHVPLVLGWVESGRAPRERAAGKLQNSFDRIGPSLSRARELAAPMLRDALATVHAASARAASS